jgi:hypothetical protein
MKTRNIFLLVPVVAIILASCGNDAKKNTALPPTPVSVTQAKIATNTREPLWL